MQVRRLLLAVAVMLLSVGPARAEHFVGFVGTHGDVAGTGIIIFGDALIDRLSDHDLLFLRLGLRREFFKSVTREHRPQPDALVVVPGHRADASEELDRLIGRLSELIRELERSDQP